MAGSGRIRAIKPGLANDVAFGSLTVEQRLLFVMLITIADDFGLFDAEPKYVRVRSFPYDGPVFNVEEMLKALSDARLIVLYTHASAPGRTFGFVRNWFKHQRIYHPSFPVVPPPVGLPDFDLGMDDGHRQVLRRVRPPATPAEPPVSPPVSPPVNGSISPPVTAPVYPPVESEQNAKTLGNVPEGLGNVPEGLGNIPEILGEREEEEKNPTLVRVEDHTNQGGVPPPGVGGGKKRSPRSKKTRGTPVKTTPGSRRSTSPGEAPSSSPGSAPQVPAPASAAAAPAQPPPATPLGASAPAAPKGAAVAPKAAAKAPSPGVSVRDAEKEAGETVVRLWNLAAGIARENFPDGRSWVPVSYERLKPLWPSLKQILAGCAMSLPSFETEVRDGFRALTQDEWWNTKNSRPTIYHAMGAGRWDEYVTIGQHLREEAIREQAEDEELQRRVAKSIKGPEMPVESPDATPLQEGIITFEEALRNRLKP